MIIIFDNVRYSAQCNKERKKRPAPFTNLKLQAGWSSRHPASITKTSIIQHFPIYLEYLESYSTHCDTPE